MAAERKYAMTRLRAGSYLLPSNDGRTLWHIYSFEDGRSHGLDEPDKTYWACARFPGSLEQAQASIESDLNAFGYIHPDHWHETATYMRSRREAISQALSNKRHPSSTEWIAWADGLGAEHGRRMRHALAYAKQHGEFEGTYE